MEESRCNDDGANNVLIQLQSIGLEKSEAAVQRIETTTYGSPKKVQSEDNENFRDLASPEEVERSASFVRNTYHLEVTTRTSNFSPCGIPPSKPKNLACFPPTNPTPEPNITPLYPLYLLITQTDPYLPETQPNLFFHPPSFSNLTPPDSIEPVAQVSSPNP